jgi:hypothetical protein
MHLLIAKSLRGFQIPCTTPSPSRRLFGTFNGTSTTNHKVFEHFEQLELQVTPFYSFTLTLCFTHQHITKGHPSFSASTRSHVEL